MEAESTTRTPHAHLRLFLAALAAVAMISSMFAISPGAARASDCVLGLCGVVYNHEGRTLVAASLDKRGGSCPPYGACGTCAVPPGTNSTRSACSAVFKDADVFTYDSTGFYLNGTHYNAHQYAKFGSYDRVDCYDYDVAQPNCSTSLS
ncbi:MAG TPA: hypothetical protein VGD53_28850 [Actinoallomurus sp.]